MVWSMAYVDCGNVYSYRRNVSLEASPETLPGLICLSTPSGVLGGRPQIIHYVVKGGGGGALANPFK